MPRYGYLFILVFILPIRHVSAQSYVMIRGAVFNMKGEALSGAHTRNISRNYGTFTDNDGNFTIIMASHDSLKVSMIGYKPYKMVIPTKLEAQSYRLKITLITDTIQLKSVEIKPYPLTYSEFRKEFVEVESPVEQYFERTKMPKTTGPLIIGGPINFFYSRYSKQAKELKKMAAIFATIALRENFLKVISPDVLRLRYNCIENEDIDDLIRFCGISEALLSSLPPTAIASRIDSCGRQWRAHRENKN
jgi:hypothetical protein